MKTRTLACPPLTGLILAGGAGRRVQGADKAWLPWLGQPLIAHVAERLLPQVGQLWISANRNMERYAEVPGCSLTQVVSDTWPDYPGPLAGIASCLTQMPPGWVLISPVDTPQLPSDLGLQLWQGLQQAHTLRNQPVAKMAVASVRTADGTIDTHWLHMLVHTDLATGLSERLHAGQRRVRDWCQAEHAVQVILDAEASSFANLNTDSDYTAPH